MRAVSGAILGLLVASLAFPVATACSQVGGFGFPTPTSSFEASHEGDPATADLVLAPGKGPSSGQLQFTNQLATTTEFQIGESFYSRGMCGPSSPGPVDISPRRATLAPGESVVITVTADTADRPGGSQYEVDIHVWDDSQRRGGTALADYLVVVQAPAKPVLPVLGAVFAVVLVTALYLGWAARKPA